MTTIAGESIEDLIAIMSSMELGEQEDGIDFNLRLNADESAIFRRALMRLEAELLLNDADELDASSVDTMRMPPQRRHDAFMLLVERIIAATERQT